MTDIKSDIISKLAEHGDGCSVNKLFTKLHYSKNDFINAKNQLIKEGIIRTKKEGLRIMLSLDRAYLIELDKSFKYNLKRYESHANDALKQLQKIKPLFEYKDSNKSYEIQVANQKIAILLRKIIDSLEAMAHHIMAFTFRYHIDQNVRKSDLKEHQKYGFDMIQKIIDRLISQHEDEEKEIRNYLLWGTSSSFSYVVG